MDMHPTDHPPGAGVRAGARVFAALLLLSLALLPGAAPPAQAADTAGTVTRTSFDHLTTGFELVGQHRDLPCESCHVNAIFRGTPKDCASCHGVGVTVRATAKPANHILTSNKCDACHTPVAWNPAVNFDHTEVKGSCSSCHNGVQATGKGPGHIDTNLECDACHSTIGWASAVFNHQGITNNCARCHDGKGATGPPANHVPIGTAGCEGCHSNTVFTTFSMPNKSATAPPGMVHGMVGTAVCSSCHEAGLSWAGVPPTVLRPQYQVPGNPASGAHVATGECSDCHTSTVTFAGAAVYPANHIPNPGGASATCANCHTVSTDYTRYTMDHAGITSNCAACHASGLSFAGVWTTQPLKAPPANHVPFTGAACEACHSANVYTTFKMANVSATTAPGMVHTAVPSATCVSCHGQTVAGTWVAAVTAPNAKGPHVPIGGADCKACHAPTNYTSFQMANAATTTPPGMVHDAVKGTACASCHATSVAGTFVGAPATKAPPTNHVPIGTAACDACHSATVFTNFVIPNTSATAAPGMVHAAVSAETCLSCHAAGVGSTFIQPVKEIPPNTAGQHVATGGADCGKCHSPTVFNSFSMANRTATSPPGMVHSYVSAAACSSCHEVGKTWLGAPVTVVRPQYLVPGNAASGNHPNTGECSDCHLNTTSFLGATLYPPTHIPNPGGSTADCAICHTTGDYAVAVMSHTGITTNCKSCHASGLKFAGVWTAPNPALKAPPSNHVPFGTANCESCHSNSNFTNFVIGNVVATAAPGMVHSVVSSLTCVGCHGQTVAATFIGSPAIKAPNANGTHVPIGSADCKTCHAATVFTAFTMTNKTATAAPGMVHTAVTGTACSTCHEAGKTWPGTPATVVRPQYLVPGNSASGLHPTGGECSNCHLNTVSFLGAVLYPTNHIPNPGGSTANCASCHTTGDYSKYVMSHAGITANCKSCHASGLTFAGTWTAPNLAMKVPPTNHIPMSTADCSACHSNTVFTNFVISNTSTAAAPGMVHSAVSALTCLTCHATGVGSKFVKAVKELPPNTAGQHVATSGADCKSCHSSTVFTSFSMTNKTATAPPGMVHSYVSALACSSCHESTKTWLGAPATVVRPQYLVPGNASSGLHPTTGECSNCHLNTVSFLGAVSYPSNHIPNPSGSSAKCTNCHTTGDYSVYVMSHTGITNNCAACHAYGKQATFAGNWTPKPLKAPPSGPTGHIPSNPPNGTLNVACESCHSATNFTTFAGTVMRHAYVTSMQCMACHELGMQWKTNTGVRLWVRDSANHHKGVDCGGSGCHSTRDKTALRRSSTVGGAVAIVRGSGGSTVGGVVQAAGVGIDHRRAAGTPCVSCHNGVGATGKPPGHVATSDNCGTCHGTQAWMPVLAVDHAQVRGSCASCHNGVAATGKGRNHITSGTDCQTCHTTNAWTPARFDHVGVAAHTCISCHDGVHASGLPLAHVPTRAQCDTCHGTLAWKPAKLDHTALTSNCASCHDNRIALGVPTGHMSTQRDCAICHSYPDWSSMHFVHDVSSYPGDHKAALTCVSCHASNTEQVAWSSPANKGTCGGCHAKDYVPASHPKVQNGLAYTAAELRDCTGACHVYTDATLRTVAKSRPGLYHRVTDAAFKH